MVVFALCVWMCDCVCMCSVVGERGGKVVLLIFQLENGGFMNWGFSFYFSEQESKTLRILDVHKYCYQLPKANFEMLELLIGHLKR